MLERIIEFINGANLAGAALKPYTGTLPKDLVKKGSKGADVKAVQTFLNWSISAKLSVDGIAGTKTVAAIKSFQKKNGLAVDGVFGPKSKAKAQALINKYKPAPKPAPSKTNAQKLVAKAKEVCWPYGTPSSKWVYKTGGPTNAYNKICGSVGRITKSDCGYFIKRLTRAAGLGAWNPLSEKMPTKYKLVLSGKKVPDGFLKPGDIIWYKKKSGQHTLMYYGDNKIAEAGRGYRFPVIRSDTKKYNASDVKHNTIKVARPK